MTAGFLCLALGLPAFVPTSQASTCSEDYADIPVSWMRNFRLDVWQALPTHTHLELDNKFSLHFSTHQTPELPFLHNLITAVTAKHQAPESAPGWLDQHWNPSTKTLELNMVRTHPFSEADRVVPKWTRVKGVPDLRSGKGMPTVLLMGLHQLKMAGIQPGEIRTLEIPQIVNRQTILEIYADSDIQEWLIDHPGQEIPRDLLGRAFARTQSAQQAFSLAWHSGHKIKDWRILGAGYSHRNRVFPENFAALYPNLRSYLGGLPKNSEILERFSVWINLESAVNL